MQGGKSFDDLFRGGKDRHILILQPFEALVAARGYPGDPESDGLFGMERLRKDLKEFSGNFKCPGWDLYSECVHIGVTHQSFDEGRIDLPGIIELQRNTQIKRVARNFPGRENRSQPV
jgi:hypothetical protein